MASLGGKELIDQCVYIHVRVRPLGANLARYTEDGMSTNTIVSTGDSFQSTHMQCDGDMLINAIKTDLVTEGVGRASLVACQGCSLVLAKMHCDETASRSIVQSIAI